MSSIRRIRDARGAVLAEFCIALVPLLTTFFAFVQLSKIATARLVVKHSAIVGARTAAVTTNGANNNPGAKHGTNEEEVEAAVKAALGPWGSQGGAISSLAVEVHDSSSREDPYNWVEVKVAAVYECRVPMGFIACGGKTKLLEERYRMPHQGAIYKEEEEEEEEEGEHGGGAEHGGGGAEHGGGGAEHGGGGEH